MCQFRLKLGAEIDERVGYGNKREGWGFYLGVLSLKKKNKTERVREREEGMGRVAV